MSGKNIGYVRVSSTGQKLDRQLEAIGEVDKLFEEKQSGKDINGRPVLKQCLEYLRDGDVLIVASIDRLARSLIDLNNIVNQLVEREISVTFLKENLAFKAGNGSDAMNQLLFNIMGSFAQFERSLIKERQAAGIAAAQKRGVQFGRKHKLNDEQCMEIKQRVDNGESKSSLAKEFGIGRQALYAAIKRVG